jgi:hypothetical protein
MSTLRGQIADRIISDLTPLKTNGTIRALARKQSLLALEAVTPAISLILGAERKLDDAEDTVCYLLTFPLWIKIAFPEKRDPGAESDAIEGAVQAAIEADPQLGGLADFIKYDSNDPYLNEESGTDGGTILQYTVQYRRAKAKPSQTYP